MIILHIGERIIEKLKETGKTESELAEKLKIATDQVKKWKNPRSYPKTEFLSTICDFLQVSPEWLLVGEENDAQSTYNNSLISGGMIMQGTNNTGTIILNGDKSVTLSPEMLELIRIYDSLNVRDRVKLMNEAFILEDSKKKK